MASIFEVARKPRSLSRRRTALVSFLLSPKPSTLLIIMIAMCALWTIFVAWGAVSLIQFLAS